VRPYLQLLGVLGLALLGAWSWRHLAADPGYVLITFAGWSVEASLLAALVVAVLIWVVVRIVVLLLRGPFRLLRRRRKSKARERLATGLLALQQGYPKRAEKLLRRAADDPVQRCAALLCAAECARQRGDDAAVRGYLMQLSEADPHATGAVAEAQALFDAGQPELAVELLQRAARERAPVPAAIELQARSLAAAGRAGEALLLMPELRRLREREGQTTRAVEDELAAVALHQAATAAELDAVWLALSRQSHSSPPVLQAYGNAAQRLGRSEDAAAVLERALDRDWDEALAAQWGGLVDGDLRRAIKRGEQWLEKHPGAAGLQLALGRLCHREELWGKAEDFLQRALAGRPAQGWEALAALYADRGDYARAHQALRNAMASGRGEPTSPVRARLGLAVEETVIEQRSSMGLPQLPTGKSA
jgi:HemY protein